jgi:hypothetical protein
VRGVYTPTIALPLSFSPADAGLLVALRRGDFEIVIRERSERSWTSYSVFGW